MKRLGILVGKFELNPGQKLSLKTEIEHFIISLRAH